MQCSHAADTCRAEVDCHCSGTASPTRLGALPDQKAQLSLDYPKVNLGLNINIPLLSRLRLQPSLKTPHVAVLHVTHMFSRRRALLGRSVKH